MTLLLTTASKHGSTIGIAKTLQACLNRAGYDTVRLPPDEVDSLAPYDAVIIGSAVYAGRWLKEARQFAETNAADLQKLPVWLFSSGPVGEPLKPLDGAAVQIENLVALTGAREHKLFAGKLDRAKLNFAEKAITYALGVKEGDYRDWGAIEAWGDKVAKELGTMPLRRRWLEAIVK